MSPVPEEGGAGERNDGAQAGSSSDSGTSYAYGATALVNTVAPNEQQESNSTSSNEEDLDPKRYLNFVVLASLTVSIIFPFNFQKHHPAYQFAKAKTKEKGVDPDTKERVEKEETDTESQIKSDEGRVKKNVKTIVPLQVLKLSTYFS